MPGLVRRLLRPWQTEQHARIVSAHRHVSLASEVASSANTAETLHAASASLAMCSHTSANAPSSSTPMTNTLHLDDVKARVYFPNPLIGFGVRKFAAGNFIRHLGDDEYALELENVHLSPVLEVNARVRVRVGYTEKHAGRVVAGVVTHVNSNGTVSVLLDNNTFVRQLLPAQVYLAESRGRLLTYNGYHELLDWIADAGVTRRAEAERIATALFYRGWRAQTMYRLQKADLMPMQYIRKSDRLVVADKAEWQRLHHVEMRGLLRERMKERDWRYFIQKYSGFVSANWAAIGVLSVFMWQLTNYRRHQRSTQLKHAVNTLTRSHSRYTSADREDARAAVSESDSRERRRDRSELEESRSDRYERDRSDHQSAHDGSLLTRVYDRVSWWLLGTPSSTRGTDAHTSHAHARHRPHNSLDADADMPYFFVDRPIEENWARQVLREFDITRPRIGVFTGVRGCGKSALLRRAIDKENKPALFVEVRGKEDALACIVRALRVPNPEACGNDLDFITDAFRKASQINGEPPVLVITLRDGTRLSRLYNEVVTLACDRMLCHVLVEVSLESVSLTSSPSTVTSASSIKEWALPRLDFYSVPNFTVSEAHQYTQHAIDPVSTQHFIEVIGTNAADIDELFSAIRQREEDAVTYINQKLNWALKQLRIAMEQATPLPAMDLSTPSRGGQNVLTPGTLALTLAHGAGGSTPSSLSSPLSSPLSEAVSHVTTRPSFSRRQRLHNALKRLAAFDFAVGQHAAAQIEDLRDPALQDIVLYDPIQDRWMFREKVFHTAARSCL